MRKDISGWVTRLTDAEIGQFMRQGVWRNETLADYAQRQIRQDADRTAVIEGESAYTYREIFTQAERLAAAFDATGLVVGDVISFQLPNWAETLAINLAACMRGVVCNPIVPIYRDAEVRYILRDCRCRMFFIPETFRSMDYAAMAARLLPDLPDLREVIVLRGEAAGCTRYQDLLRRGDGRAPAPVRVDPNAIKLILYTSGTTGKAKGVLHSHNTIMAELHAVIDYWSVTPEDVVLMPSPVTHITGYLYALEMAFVRGLKVVFMERWDAAQAIALVDRHNVTFSVGATPFLKELVAEALQRNLALPSLRLFACGGAPVPPELIHRAHEALENCVACRVYGSTEAPTVTLGVNRRDQEQLGASTDGHIVGHEVRLCDPVTGDVVAEGADGEICTRGPEVMIGYTDWKQTEESFDSEGFFHTGDLGHYASVDFLVVSGRKKDLIIRGGENISPKEIEDILHQHPAMKEVAVVAMPSERMGETVCAYVITNPGCTIDLPQLVDFLDKAGLSKQKFPERIEIVDDLPRTPSGKVQKNLLRQRLVEKFRTEQAGGKRT